MKNDFAVVRAYVALIKEVAFKMPAPNEFTPELIQIADQLEQWAIARDAERLELLQGDWDE